MKHWTYFYIYIYIIKLDRVDRIDNRPFTDYLQNVEEEEKNQNLVCTI